MDLLALFSALNRNGVRYVLVGGLAQSLQGYVRDTMDIDMALALDAENLQRFLKVAVELRLKPDLPVTIEAFCDPRQVAQWVSERRLIAFTVRGTQRGDPAVDILVDPRVPFEDLYSRKVELRVRDTIPVSVAALDDLIALKTGTGRKKDEYDLELLHELRRQQLDDHSPD